MLEFNPSEVGWNSKPAAGTFRKFSSCHSAFIFALDIEVGGLVNLRQDQVRSRCATFVQHSVVMSGRGVVVVETRVGREAVARAVEDVIAVQQPFWIVSAGFAGAMRDELKLGNVLMADAVADESGLSLSVGLKLEPQTIAGAPALVTSDDTRMTR